MSMPRATTSSNACTFDQLRKPVWLQTLCLHLSRAHPEESFLGTETFSRGHALGALPPGGTGKPTFLAPLPAVKARSLGGTGSMPSQKGGAWHLPRSWPSCRPGKKILGKKLFLDHRLRAPQLLGSKTYRVPNASAVRIGLVPDTSWFPPVWTEAMLCALRTLVWRSDLIRIFRTCASIGSLRLGM
eukprot:5764686-Amphidinium_carterae.1